MYIPAANKEDRLPVLHKLMEDQPFASLITVGSLGLFASHIPMVVEREGGPLGRLKGHLSRANGQWKDISASVEALAIFSGPQHYITPSWYPEKQETGRVVPTWNYAVVHAYGYMRVIEDGEWLMAHLESLTNIHEADSAVPWKVSDAPASYVASLVKGIVGLEMVIERIEGKWKASQNRSEEDRVGVARGLAELDTEESLAMKALVDERR
ncbi:FMN-binding negative transcriptional regulator [Granulicella sp. L60]|uniref:FMN-binding negative transcriptional regulator n=1 Tax=Granulicella sp. L60 TaxID=1641866 RepID=UPI00131CA056|nr:FMN-binding negative transcriptional regulator [Granulicella sp. L60]